MGAAGAGGGAEGGGGQQDYLDNNESFMDLSSLLIKTRWRNSV